MESSLFIMNISQFLFSLKKASTEGRASGSAINWGNPVIMDSKFWTRPGRILFYQPLRISSQPSASATAVSKETESFWYL